MNARRNAEIIRLRKEGVGPRAIARRLSLSPNVVAGALNRAGLTKGTRKTGGRGCGYPVTFKVRVVAHTRMASISETARAWGVARRTVQKWRLELAA